MLILLGLLLNKLSTNKIRMINNKIKRKKKRKVGSTGAKGQDELRRQERD